MQFKRTPWGHQYTAIQRAVPLHNFAFLMEMGTGKTGAAIMTLETKFQTERKLFRTIIFCPPMVIPNWVDEWKAFSHVDPKFVHPLYGSQDKRRKEFVKHAYRQGNPSLAPEPAIFICNYESLLMQGLFAEFLHWAPEALIFDESHKLKNPTSQRAKKADTLANPYRGKQQLPKPHTYLLSGTPILNSAQDIFMQYKVLDNGATFGHNFFRFRAMYFRDKNVGMSKDKYFPDWRLMNLKDDGVDAIGEINSKIYEKGIRVEKKDCLDLPPEVSVTVKVGMTPEQARVYKEMKNDFITFYNSRACTAELAITKALRLMQITSGFIATEHVGYDETTQVLSQFKDTPKARALAELLEEITEQGGKVLVWAVFTENYRQIRAVCESLGLGYVEVHGGVDDATKRDNIDKFKSDPKCHVFIGHPGSGGIGINLTVAGYSIFYSRNFSLEHYLQARARNHRGGALEAGHAHITHYDLVVEETIDELSVQKLANKLDLSDKLLKDISQELAAQRY